jgi:hypothetical protein
MCGRSEGKELPEANENGLLHVSCRRRSLHSRYGAYWWFAVPSRRTSCMRL